MKRDSSRSAGAKRTLPDRPSLEHLKNQAKQRLKQLRKEDEAAKLADAQRIVAREYGFSSWRAIKAHVDLKNDRSTRGSIDEFIAAIHRHDLAGVRAMLNAVPGLVNDARRLGKAPVVIAASNEHHGSPEGLVKLLIEFSSELTLHEAAATGNTEAVAKLVTRVRAALNEADEGGMTALMWAAHGRHDETVRALLERGADTRPAGHDESWTALHLATDWSSLGMVRDLLDHGGEIEAETSDGKRPIHTALRLARADVVDFLVSRGARSDAFVAAGLGRLEEMVEHIRRDPALLHARLGGDRGPTLLMLATEAKQRTVVDWLINHGLELDAITAVRLGRFDELRTRTEKFGSLWLNATDLDGLTALHHAVTIPDMTAIETLIALGARLDVKDPKWNATPRGWAEYLRHTEAARVIEQAEAK
jgi:ankyrin repeat protein